MQTTIEVQPTTDEQVTAELVEVATTTTIAKYNPVEAGLARLKAELQGVVWDLKTTKGYKEARAKKTALVTLRTTLDKTEKELKVPAKKALDLISSEAKRIKAEILIVEKEIGDQLDAEDARKEQAKKEAAEAEQKRVKGILAKLQGFGRLYSEVIGKSLDDIAARGQEVNDLINSDLKADYQEYADDARSQLQNICEQLKDLYRSAKQAERDRAKEAEEKAQRDAERLAAKAEADARQKQADELTAKLKAAEEREAALQAQLASLTAKVEPVAVVVEPIAVTAEVAPVELTVDVEPVVEAAPISANDVVENIFASFTPPPQPTVPATPTPAAPAVNWPPRRNPPPGTIVGDVQKAIMEAPTIKLLNMIEREKFKTYVHGVPLENFPAWKELIRRFSDVDTSDI